MNHSIAPPAPRWSLPTTVALLTLAIVIGSCSGSPPCSSEPEPTERPGESSTEEPQAPAEPTQEEREAAFSTGIQSILSASEAARKQARGEWEEMVSTAMDPSQPLPALVRRSLEAIEYDPHPESLTRGNHYWVSNEDNHYLFRDALDDQGGIFIGVGTDQNYLMAAWAKSSILIPMDFDEEIRNVHHLYEVMFSRAETPSEFIDLWASNRSDEMYAALEEKYGEGQRYDELESAYDTAAQTIHWRLRTTASTYEELDIPTFLTDQEQYDFIRNLWERGRVIPVRGDLTGDVTLVDIATTLEELDLHTGVIYTSNAEQYFDFIPSFRRNIAVQPFDEESLLLRTRPASAFGLADGGDYHYNVQPAQNFSDWMTYSRIPNSWNLLMRHREDSDVKGLSYIREEPEHADDPPELAEIPGADQ